LRDARKFDLVPSVTNVLGVIAKPELTAWLQEQAVLAALTLPRIDGESEDVFAKRVVTDSLTTRDGAADFGTAFHHGAERVAQRPARSFRELVAVLPRLVPIQSDCVALDGKSSGASGSWLCRHGGPAR
jgi:hypothetical protein